MPPFSEADLIAGDHNTRLFLRPRIVFLPKRENGSANSLGLTLVSIGEREIAVFRCAKRDGQGICFRPDIALIRSMPTEAAD
jgi:hypothetical protein